jgi:divalent metal cation (Fe/Co/Zn/Cd) transporter
VSAEGSTKAILAALVANAGIAVAKFVAFLLTGAASMLAESIHSVADSSNQGLLLLGGAFALYEGVQKLLHPHAVESMGIAVGVLLFAIALETFSLRTAIVESRRAKGDAGWWEFIRHSRSPELPVVLLEDIGAEAGLVLALLAVVLAQVTGNPDFDAYGTMSIGVLLLVIAVFLMIEMKGLLIGETARPRDEEAVLRAVSSTPRVRSVLHMRTQHLGPDDVLVGMKVELEPSLDVAGVAAAINEAESAIRSALPSATIVYVEPDVRTPERVD